MKIDLYIYLLNILGRFLVFYVCNKNDFYVYNMKYMMLIYGNKIIGFMINSFSTIVQVIQYVSYQTGISLMMILSFSLTMELTWSLNKQRRLVVCNVIYF